jgi:hypothetical protein
MCKSAVGQDIYGQLTGTGLVQLRSQAIIYANEQNQAEYRVANQLPAKKFAKYSDYLTYRRGQILAASRPTLRPQSSIMTDLQALT